jgi:hypothetical protein
MPYKAGCHQCWSNRFACSFSKPLWDIIQALNHTLRMQMQVHIFRGPGRVFGFTTDSSGANLPPKYAPWTAFKTIELQKDQPVPSVDVNDCLNDLESFGVHVTDAHVRITEEAIRL